jgi:hypothetical protein
MLSPPEIESGDCHNEMLGMAKDTVLRFTTLPRLMLTMLETDGWRRLVRPSDHRVFENATIDAWVLGEPWAGLHFSHWAMVYALLGKNVEAGPQCIRALQRAGAPSRSEAERVFRIAAAKEGPGINANGRPNKGSTVLPLSKSSRDPARLAARLKRDYPDTLAALERGEYASVKAAARAAGIVRDKTALEQLQRWWTKATADEQSAFRSWMAAQ